jgi:lipoprotein-anchoring transpeptidase ErfK/SrfK
MAANRFGFGPMKQSFLLCGAAALSILATPAVANERYVEPPPLVVSPDLSAPWVMQLQRGPNGAPVRPGQRKTMRMVPAPEPARPAKVRAPAYRAAQDGSQHTTAVPAPKQPAETHHIEPKFLPQVVAYDGPHQPGTIIIDTGQRFLFLVLEDGKARRYGVGVGKEGFAWKGTETITRKREWPDWRPPAEMIAREKKKGRNLPVHMAGGPENPLGARALYLGSTLYRIHGTNAPWSIGKAVSSGCIRMRNEDVIELYERVGTGTKVVVT